ncbi:MAG: LysM peptidoglycan-binding domain-containing protein [Candidatus Omnitrophica bacterium]|nr:LysM peptidoglycan-binding domain-containing protein [Candidatus Omnitrophota bacterium]MDD5352526.1 LysM peptidoglycan-binding domain-containing protein [Candidatus Omnitrophota bacterium]MDD5550124.1 LysM peptidoglycan-binding domain-containing protein [Candidatus Omnitrophota bacterium]
MDNKKISRIQYLCLMVFVLAFASSGCLVRSYTVVKERPDQVIEGNQGYLKGSAPARKTVEKKTRTTYVTEVELGKHNKQAAQAEATSQKAEGKEGVSQNAMIYEESVAAPEQAPAATPAASTETAKKSKTYVVKQGDTLEKISARPEIYGTKHKWYKIFKANEGQLKTPNKIYPGQVLNIPAEE